MSTPVEKFGKDHWSLLAYLASRCIDAEGAIGEIERDRVRCNPHTHPMLVGHSLGAGLWKDEYSTKLSGYFDFAERANPKKAAEAGFMILGHDDWDCMDDLEDAGYIELISMVNGFVKMTSLGMKVVGKLSEYKARGGIFANFSLEEEPAAIPAP